jgi:hypothetical protein
MVRVGRLRAYRSCRFIGAPPGLMDSPPNQLQFAETASDLLILLEPTPGLEPGTARLQVLSDPTAGIRERSPSVTLSRSEAAPKPLRTVANGGEHATVVTSV